MRITNIVNDTINDVIEFRKLSYESFKQVYKDDIRISIDFKKITPIDVDIHFTEKEDLLQLPWYEKGSWADGETRSTRLGKNFILVRLPAIKLGGNEFFILDGCHRLIELMPGLIIIDYMILNKNDYKYVIDLYNDKFCDKKYKGK